MLGTQKTKSIRSLIAAAVVLAAGMAFAAPASAANIFERMAVINSQFGVVKVFLIWVAFLIGWGVLIGAGLEMHKMSKPETRGDATWRGVLIKAIAGAFLVYVTLSNDIIKETLFGGSGGGGSSPNTSMYQPKVLRLG